MADPDTQTATILELLAAVGAPLPVRRLHTTALVLWRTGSLRTTPVLGAGEPETARLDQLLTETFNAFDAGLVRRYAGTVSLTLSGHAAVEARGLSASGETRRIAAELSGMEPDEASQAPRSD